MGSLEPASIAQNWLDQWSAAVEACDANAASLLFLTGGWLRSVVALSWDTFSVSTPTKIKEFLAETLPKRHLNSFTFDNSQLPIKFFSQPGSTVQGVEAPIRGRAATPEAILRGFLRLLPDEQGNYKAYSLSLAMEALVGHEERVGGSDQIWHGEPLHWDQQFQIDIDNAGANADVVVVGAGHNGLMCTARFERMGIKTLLIDKTDRVGNAWRDPTLTLHTPSLYSTFLYHPYPENWPVFAPKTKIANWMEDYARNLDLPLWLNTEVRGDEDQPTYNEATGRWRMPVFRNGKKEVLTPRFIVWATGHIGRPRIPETPGMELFKGVMYHSSEHQDASQFRGRKVVVVGAATSAGDICQDLHAHKADVTMIQRSSTCITSVAALRKLVFDPGYPLGVNVYDCDQKMFSQPNNLTLSMGKGFRKACREIDADLLAGYEKAGYMMNDGPNDAGHFGLLLTTGSGYMLDVGAGELIANKEIKLSMGTVASVTPKGLILDSGEEIDADVIIWSTGFIRNSGPGSTLNLAFGDDFASQLPPLWGLDAAGEINGAYRALKHAGFFYAAGDMMVARYFSRHLGLVMKARMLGLEGAFDGPRV